MKIDKCPECGRGDYPIWFLVERETGIGGRQVSGWAESPNGDAYCCYGCYLVISKRGKILERNATITPLNGSKPGIDFYGENEETGQREPMTCNDCGDPCYYWEGDANYHHAKNPEEGCFLIDSEDIPEEPMHPLLRNQI